MAGQGRAALVPPAEGTAPVGAGCSCALKPRSARRPSFAERSPPAATGCRHASTPRPCGRPVQANPHANSMDSMAAADAITNLSRSRSDLSQALKQDSAEQLRGYASIRMVLLACSLAGTQCTASHRHPGTRASQARTNSLHRGRSGSTGIWAGNPRSSCAGRRYAYRLPGIRHRGPNSRPPRGCVAGKGPRPGA